MAEGGAIALGNAVEGLGNMVNLYGTRAYTPMYNATQSIAHSPGAQIAFDADPFLYNITTHNAPVAEIEILNEIERDALKNAAEMQAYWGRVNEEINAGRIGRSTITQAQYAMSAATMIPYIALSAVPIVGSFAANLYLYASTMGTAYERGWLMSRNHEKAQNYAIASATTELIVENMMGTIPGFGDGYLSNLVNRYLPQEGLGGMLKKWGVNALGEGYEEGFTTILDPVLQRITGVNPEAQNASLVDVWNAVLDGTAMGGLMGAPGAVTGYYGTANYYNNLLTEVRNEVILEPQAGNSSNYINIIETVVPDTQNAIQVYTDGNAQINVGKIDLYIRGKVNVDIDAVNARVAEIETIEMQQPNILTIEMQEELKMDRRQIHNYVRSQQMNEILNNAGIADTSENNMEIARLILETSAEVNVNNLETNVLLVTPNGTVLLVAKWQILKDGTPYVVTIILKTV